MIFLLRKKILFKKNRERKVVGDHRRNQEKKKRERKVVGDHHRKKEEREREKGGRGLL